MFESLNEYQNWENNRNDIEPKDEKTPTIGLVLQSLKKMKFFEKIIVTTDHKKIANISKKYGADVILYRDKKLLKDHVGT